MVVKAKVGFIILIGTAVAILAAPVSDAAKNSGQATSEQQTGQKEKRIAELIARLGGDREARTSARTALIEIGQETVPALIKTLDSAEFTLRWEAVNTLGYIRDPRATEPLVGRILNDENSHVRWRAIWAVKLTGEKKAGELLLDKLKAKDESMRWNAAVALSVMGKQEAVPVLLAGLDSSDTWRRWEAVNGLGRVHDEKTAARLSPLLKDPERNIRQETALSLGKLGDRKAVPALIEALKDPEPGVRWRAAAALGKIGSPDALEPLGKARRDETDTEVIKQIDEAISKISKKKQS